MNKPNNYDNVTVGGDFTPVTLGGHYMIIKGVEERTSKNGKPMVVVAFDFDKKDSQAEYFAEMFKADVRPEKKWPHNGTKYIMSEDADRNASKSLKSFIIAFEKSNNCECVWGDKFTGQFKGKKIGGVFGEVENEYNGKTTMRHELRWFCEVDKVAGASVPEPSLLNGSSVTKATNNSDFMEIKTDAAEEIPF